MIGNEQFQAIERLDFAGHRLEKFFRDPRQWFRRAFQRCVRLGLADLPKRWILDVGSAIPYFAAAADLFDHDVLSLDLPDPLVAEAAELLGADFVGHVMTPHEPLPELPHRFDLITMFGVNLRLEEKDLDMKAYGKVVDGLVRHVNPGGRVIVAPNRTWLGGRWQLVSKWRRVLKRKVRITNCGDWVAFDLK